MKFNIILKTVITKSISYIYSSILDRQTLIFFLLYPAKTMFSLYTAVIVVMSLATSFAATCTVDRMTGHCVDVSRCTGTSVVGKCAAAPPHIQCCIQTDISSGTANRFYGSYEGRSIS
jgi:hypothetical protein